MTTHPKTAKKVAVGRAAKGRKLKSVSEVAQKAQDAFLREKYCKLVQQEPTDTPNSGKAPFLSEEPDFHGDIYSSYADVAEKEKAASAGEHIAFGPIKVPFQYEYANSLTGQTTPASPTTPSIGSAIWGLNDPTVYVLLKGQKTLGDDPSDHPFYNGVTIHGVVSSQREADIWKNGGDYATYIAVKLNALPSAEGL
jgi:hypothetical protein